MLTRRPRAVRLLQVVLACTVLWLSSGVAAAAPRVIDGIVLVASAAGDGTSASNSQHKPAAPAATDRSLVRSISALATSALEPTRTTKNLVLVRYRYLRNCTLLR